MWNFFGEQYWFTLRHIKKGVPSGWLTGRMLRDKLLFVNGFLRGSEIGEETRVFRMA